MSIDNIIKYINETPGNTNPSVVKSMVEAEMRSVLPIIKISNVLKNSEDSNDYLALLTTEEINKILKLEKMPFIVSFNMEAPEIQFEFNVVLNFTNLNLKQSELYGSYFSFLVVGGGLASITLSMEEGIIKLSPLI